MQILFVGDTSGVLGRILMGQHLMDKPTVVDLFSGAGGLSIGLKAAGLEPIFGVELDRDSAETYRASSKHDVMNVDVLDFLENVRSKKITLPKIYLLAGGPPCQGFCAINPKRHSNDPRNSLVDAFLYGVELLKPENVLIENVTGLLSLASGAAIYTIEKRLRALGYFVGYKVLQAAHYGVPQSRWRLIVLASKKGEPKWPEPTHGADIVPNFVRGKELTFRVSEPDLFSSLISPNSVGDAISDLPNLKNGENLSPQFYPTAPLSELQVRLRKENNILHNHCVKKLEQLNLDRVQSLPNGGMNWTDLPYHLVPKNLVRMRERYGTRVGSKTRFGRLKWDGLFSTVVTSPDPYWGSFIHPQQDRVISVREAARAQTFPDQVRFSGGINSQYRQVGNAVPPMLAEAIGRVLMQG
jgi:DNA (cytosine-5)-methyltransferase 1